jgi:ribosomal protein L11 methyltransferase
LNDLSGDVIELSVAVDGEAAEAVCELFERYGGGAVVEIQVTAGTDDGQDLPVPQTHVRTYIDANDVEMRARLEVGLWHLGRLYPIPEASARKLAQANWAEAWRAHYSPQRIGQHFLIVPSWLPPEPQPGDRVIRLDPGMTFGTGLHPTTRLCLVALETLTGPGARVLDVGCGSGILAIGAARLGAARVVALDINPDAVATAAANAALNGVALDTFAGELAGLPAERFDVITANLLASTISELAPTFPQYLVPGGVLIASGILADQAAAVTVALGEAGLATVDTLPSGDWVALIARPRAGDQ